MKHTVQPFNAREKVKVALENDPVSSDDFFAAGDIRANEQVKFPWASAMNA